MKKHDYFASSLTLVLLIFSVIISSGCARNGEFSKEGAYEILRGINNSQDTTIHDEPKEDVDYREYERRRESVLNDNK